MVEIATHLARFANVGDHGDQPIPVGPDAPEMTWPVLFSSAGGPVDRRARPAGDVAPAARFAKLGRRIAHRVTGPAGRTSFRRRSGRSPGSRCPRALRMEPVDRTRLRGIRVEAAWRWTVGAPTGMLTAGALWRRDGASMSTKPKRSLVAGHVPIPGSPAVCRRSGLPNAQPPAHAGIEPDRRRTTMRARHCRPV